MRRQPISGSAIRSIGHDGHTLEVELTGGVIVRHVGVPAQIWLDMLDTKAPMAYYNRNVREKYRREGDTGDGPPPGPGTQGGGPRGPAPKTRPPGWSCPGYDPHHTRRPKPPAGPASPRAIKVPK